jgi:hypothetical protein
LATAIAMAHSKAFQSVVFVFIVAGMAACDGTSTDLERESDSLRKAQLINSIPTMEIKAVSRN